MTPMVENQVEKKLEREMEVVRKILHDKVPYALELRQKWYTKVMQDFEYQQYNNEHLGFPSSPKYITFADLRVHSR